MYTMVRVYEYGYTMDMYEYKNTLYIVLHEAFNPALKSLVLIFYHYFIFNL